MEIERGGHTVPTVKKALVSPLRDRFSIDVERDGDSVAEVSKRWFRVRDTYAIEIAPDQDDPLILAVTVCIDQMTHDVS